MSPKAEDYTEIYSGFQEFQVGSILVL
ncbi:hypothetical protein CCACVL1_27178 [Corchorus capsularis]|uniref:Uncharacterized protein n=1 Tax=Corchorus capsularis TaxID=210143 RepID=A0A1R3GBU9_COCAP|nr:hypothetical protein CCACVL1_27178 [Corchorus capsularis]